MVKFMVPDSYEINVVCQTCNEIVSCGYRRNFNKWYACLHYQISQD